MVRIAISEAAFDAIAKTLARQVGYENAVNEHGQRYVGLTGRCRPARGDARHRRGELTAT
jgi:hypothetical protein